MNSHDEHDIDHIHHADDAIDWQHPVDLLEPEDIEDAQDIDLSGIGRIPTDALRIFCTMLIPVGKPSPRLWRTATSRLVTLAHAIGVDGIADRSLAELAASLGVSRALLSFNEVRLRDVGHLGHRGGRSDEARAVYASRARHIWRQKHNGTAESSKRLQGGKESKPEASPRNCAHGPTPVRSLLDT